MNATPADMPARRILLAPSEATVAAAVTDWHKADLAYRAAMCAADNARIRAAAAKRKAQALIDAQDVAHGRTPVTWPEPDPSYPEEEIA